MIYIEGGPIWLFYLARLVEIGIIILLTVVWCNSMERALRACSYSSRKMQLGQSWLIFVPLFGFIWQFVAVNRVSISLATEYHLRGWKSDEGRPGIETGLIACVVVLVVFLLRTFLILNPGLAVLMSLAICICMYMHRERLNAFTERLEAENRKAQQNFSFDSGPNPFQQQSFSQQYGTYNQQPNYNSPVQQQFPQYNQPLAQHSYEPTNPFQPQQYFPPVQQYGHQQYVNQLAAEHQQQQKRELEKKQQAGGWDGITTWEAPEGWKHPDLTDPRPYFS